MSAKESPQKQKELQDAAERRAAVREAIPGLIFSVSILGMALAVAVWFVFTRVQGGS